MTSMDDAHCLFSRIKDQGRVALRRDKTSRSWMCFAHLAAIMINMRLTKCSHAF